MDLGDRRGIRLQPGESVYVVLHVRHRYFTDGDLTAVFRLDRISFGVVAGQ